MNEANFAVVGALLSSSSVTAEPFLDFAKAPPVSQVCPLPRHVATCRYVWNYGRPPAIAWQHRRESYILYSIRSSLLCCILDTIRAKKVYRITWQFVCFSGSKWGTNSNTIEWHWHWQDPLGGASGYYVRLRYAP